VGAARLGCLLGVTLAVVAAAKGGTGWESLLILPKKAPCTGNPHTANGQS